MLHVERVLLVLLTLWGVVCTSYWTAGIVRFIRTRLEVSLATDPDKFPDPPEEEGRNGAWPTVCVVVPAHNEEASIGALLETLKQQDYPADRLKVVFSLDRCTDGTERVLREGFGGDDRFAIHTIDHCPPDWAGKVHAL